MLGVARGCQGLLGVATGCQGLPGVATGCYGLLGVKVRVGGLSFMLTDNFYMCAGRQKQHTLKLKASACRHQQRAVQGAKGALRSYTGSRSWRPAPVDNTGWELPRTGRPGPGLGSGGSHRQRVHREP